MKMLMDKIEAILGKPKDIILLVIRLTLGIIFIQTGFGKLTHLSNTTEFFANLRIPFPMINAVMAGSTEFFGGILLVFGFLTRLISIPLTFVMIVAILTAQLANINGFSDFIRLQEWDYILFFVLLMSVGAGKYSLDASIRSKISPKSSVS